jgi:Mn2+/Fe2+ NRAMP family transporter
MYNNNNSMTNFTKYNFTGLSAWLFVIVLLFFGFLMTVQSPLAGAVEPGCYRLQVRQGAVAIECQTPEQAAAVERGSCFVIQPRAQSLEEVSCTELDPIIDSGGSVDGGETLDTDCNEAELTQDNCDIIKYLVGGINFLSALAGLAIVASLMIAGYQYMTAQDNSGKIQQAKSRIYWVIGALLLFIFMYALLDFLVPGGVLPS